MKKTVVRIPSKLYSSLYNIAEKNSVDPDRLIATYCILKHFREDGIKYYSYKSSNNKFVSGLSLLRAKTPLSLSVIKKYVPFLIEEGLICIDKGDVVLIGNEKLKNKYNRNKLVPIVIGKNLVETTRYSYSVRLHSSKNSQERMISKKKHRSELILQSSNPYSLKQLKQGNAVLNRFGEQEIIDKVILSNQGYSDLKGGVNNSKSKGGYWKSKMKEQGLLETRRQFKLIKKMSYKDYKFAKYHSDELVVGKYTYIRGHLAEEICSIMIPINTINPVKTVEEKTFKTTVVNKQKVSPAKHLDFDFIAWVQNENITAKNYRMQ